MSDYKRPKVGLGVIVIKDGKVLIGTRTVNDSNTSQPPGGHLELGESWEACARREVREEAGIEVTNVQFLGVTNDFRARDNNHYITIYMKCDYASGEVVNCEPDKCNGWEWMRWENIPSPRFLPLENLIKQGVHPLATYHGKLVRDRIPEIITSKGDLAATHIAGMEEYKRELQNKLAEEVEEYFESESMEELADILEVVHSLNALHGVNREQLQLLQKEKRDERGGFEEKIILDETR